MAGTSEGLLAPRSLTGEVLLDVLAAAEAVLEATGYAVALCPVYGPQPGG